MKLFIVRQYNRKKAKHKLNKQSKFTLFLENNKIYFEIFSNIFLGIAAIIVSIFIVNENIKQTDIQKEQADIQNIQLLPRFIITAVIEESETNGKKTSDDNVYVINDGGFFRDFNIELVTVLDISKIDLDSYSGHGKSRFILTDFKKKKNSIF